MPPTRQVSNAAADAGSESRFRHFACSACKWRCLRVNLPHCVCVLLVCCAVCCRIRTACGLFADVVCLWRPGGLQLQRHAAYAERRAVLASRWSLRRGGSADTRHPEHLPASPRPMAAALQADSVRRLSQPTLLLCTHAVPRMDERATRRSARGRSARATLLPRSDGGEKATSSRPLTDGSGAFPIFAITHLSTPVSHPSHRHRSICAYASTLMCRVALFVCCSSTQTSSPSLLATALE